MASFLRSAFTCLVLSVPVLRAQESGRDGAWPPPLRGWQEELAQAYQSNAAYQASYTLSSPKGSAPFASLVILCDPAAGLFVARAHQWLSTPQVEHFYARSGGDRIFYNYRSGRGWQADGWMKGPVAEARDLEALCAATGIVTQWGPGPGTQVVPTLRPWDPQAGSIDLVPVLQIVSAARGPWHSLIEGAEVVRWDEGSVTFRHPAPGGATFTISRRTGMLVEVGRPGLEHVELVSFVPVTRAEIGEQLPPAGADLPYYRIPRGQPENARREIFRTIVQRADQGRIDPDRLRAALAAQTEMMAWHIQPEGSQGWKGVPPEVQARGYQWSLPETTTPEGEEAILIIREALIPAYRAAAEAYRTQVMK